MRVLLASTQGAGHFNPLVPFAAAARRRGDEVLVAGPEALGPLVEAAALPFWECAGPREEDIRPVWGRVQTVSPDQANVLVMREIFARLDARALLPRLREAFEAWRPDLVLRDPNEYASAVAADLYSVPHARVAIGLGGIEEGGLDIAAATVGELRAEVGLEEVAAGERIRRTPYLTAFPASLEAPDLPGPQDARRYREPTADATAAPLPDWWPGQDGPLVYVTLGSVAAAMPHAARAFPIVLDAVAELPVRVLMTVGRAGDPEAFDPLPPNVRVERWVPHADAVVGGAVVVGHGGAGATLGTLAAGVPQVVVPLFADQPYNAERVAAVDAGLIAEPEVAAIRAAVELVLADDRHRSGAERVRDEMRALPAVDDVLAGLP